MLAHEGCEFEHEWFLLGQGDEPSVRVLAGIIALSEKGKRMATDAPPLELEPASPEVKRYQRQNITIAFVSAAPGLGWMALLGFVFGPELGKLYTDWFGDEQTLRLLASAAVLGVTLELLTLPLDFYSGFVLEHRHHLSNQTI